MAQSCSHWWYAIALALIAISTAADATNATVPSVEVIRNASSTLRTQGFTIIATLLEFNSEIFFSPSSSSAQTTIFAPPDSALANTSLPLWARNLFLQYHTVPSQNLPFRALLRISSNTCLATGVPSKNIAITKINPQERLIEINHSPISHPDLFLGGPISIHGVLAPFTTLHSQETTHLTPDFIRSPFCPPSSSISAPKSPGWGQIIWVLSRRSDFVSFAVGLNSVLESIIRDYPDMNSGTIFAPNNLQLVNSPLLNHIVRYHVLPERYDFSVLASFPAKTTLRTLERGRHLEITSAFNATAQTVAIDGVEVTMPDVCSTEGFVVHAISRPFKILPLHNSQESNPQ